VIDTSAIVAIALDEPEAPEFERRIAGDPVRLISAATVLEAAMVIETRLGEAGGSELDLWLHKADVEIVAVERDHADDQARRAWRRFGKGRHPAGLNFGDCFSYALAALTQEPLLFKGEDFAKTDIRAA
jgi:ribonuclease VapC